MVDAKYVIAASSGARGLSSTLSATLPIRGRARQIPVSEPRPVPPLRPLARGPARAPGRFLRHCRSADVAVRRSCPRCLRRLFEGIGRGGLPRGEQIKEEPDESGRETNQEAPAPADTGYGGLDRSKRGVVYCAKTADPTV